MCTVLEIEIIHLNNIDCYICLERVVGKSKTYFGIQVLLLKNREAIQNSEQLLNPLL